MLRTINTDELKVKTKNSYLTSDGIEINSDVRIINKAEDGFRVVGGITTEQHPDYPNSSWVETDQLDVNQNAYFWQRAKCQNNTEFILPKPSSFTSNPLSITKSLQETLISINVTGAMVKNNWLTLALRRIGSFVEFSLRMTSYALTNVDAEANYISSPVGIIPLEYRPRGFSDAADGTKLRLNGILNTTSAVSWILHIKNDGQFSILQPNPSSPWIVGMNIAILENSGSWLSLV